MSIFEKMLQALSVLPSELYIFIISMLPIVELRAAIPIGALLGVPFYLNYIIAVLGNMVPIPFILLFIPKILDYLEKFKFFRPIVRRLKGKASKNSKRVLEAEANAENETPHTAATDSEADRNDTAPTECARRSARKMGKAVFISLMLFVALPLPGTGAWSGGLVASLFDLPKKQSFLAILLGVLICGVIMTLASYGILSFLSFLV